MKIYHGLRSTFRLAICQFGLKEGKQPNMEKAETVINKAAGLGADLICVPEYFTFHPLRAENVRKYAEEFEGETKKLMSGLAKKHKVYLLGGSFPEIDKGNIYNTSVAYDPEGKVIMKYQKIHLFDVNIVGKTGKMIFSESAAITKGNDIGVLTTPFGKFGIGLCYDLRFSLLARAYANKGCKMLLYPAMFSNVTGPPYWDLLQRARAVDNQVFVATIATSRDENASYVSWGHSGVVDPYGNILKQAGFDDETIVMDIDFSVVDELRRQLPILEHTRTDLYNLVTTV